MDERIVRFRVGVMVLAAVLITGILVLLLGKGTLPTLAGGTYKVIIHFDDAPSVSKSMPVRKSGVLIGRVTEVELDEDGGVRVTAQIESKYRLNRNNQCQVVGTLLGDSALQFVLDQTAPQTKEMIEDGDKLVGVTTSDPSQVLRNLEPDLRKMINSVTRTSDDIGGISKELRAVLGQDDQLGRVVQKMEKTLDSVRLAMDNVNDVLGDPQVKADFRQSVAELPKVLKESRDAFSGLKDTLALADRNLQNLEGFTKPLGQRGEELFVRLDRGAVKMERLLDQLNAFGTSLNNRQGTLGKLMSDPELYNNLNDTAANINDLTRQLRPILSDVRVFTDKIARDPGRIGVRGVFQQNSGIK